MNYRLQLGDISPEVPNLEHLDRGGGLNETQPGEWIPGQTLSNGSTGATQDRINQLTGIFTTESQGQRRRMTIDNDDEN